MELMNIVVFLYLGKLLYVWTFLGSLFWMFVMSSAIAVWSQRSGETNGIPPEVRNCCNEYVYMLF